MCRACELSKTVLGLQLDGADNKKLMDIRLQEYDLVATQRTSLELLKVEITFLFNKDLDIRQRIGLRQAELLSFLKSDLYKPHDGQVGPSTMH